VRTIGALCCAVFVYLEHWGSTNIDIQQKFPRSPKELRHCLPGADRNRLRRTNPSAGQQCKCSLVWAVVPVDFQKSRAVPALDCEYGKAKSSRGQVARNDTRGRYLRLLCPNFQSPTGFSQENAGTRKPQKAVCRTQMQGAG
jgi:hypothetical protein